jgi:hypothetical protein
MTQTIPMAKRAVNDRLLVNFNISSRCTLGILSFNSPVQTARSG